MPQYQLRGHPTPRPRDFFDIHSILSRRLVETESADFADLLGKVFAAKEVELKLLSNLPSQRSFHAQAWDSVVADARGVVLEFDYYFDFVLERCAGLQIPREP